LPRKGDALMTGIDPEVPIVARLAGGPGVR
jgi:hypothetical protein